MKKISPDVLRGNHVRLRAIERNDLPQLLEWRNDPDNRRYFREYRELGMDQQIEWYENVVLRDPNTLMFSINDAAGQLIGACGLTRINWIHKNADLSLYIGADNVYIDETRAPEAARVLLTYGFMELEMHRIWAEIYDFDDRKMRFLDELGFTLDGRHRETYFYEGRWHDSLFYGMLASEYKK